MGMKGDKDRVLRHGTCSGRSPPCAPSPAPDSEGHAGGRARARGPAGARAFPLLARLCRSGSRAPLTVSSCSRLEDLDSPMATSTP